MASTVFGNDLPLELVDSLNSAYFLHILATEPERVVPPGKSVLSMLLQSQLSSQKKSLDDGQPLLERVKEAAHKAFWGEAAESLSNPEPAVQLPRLKRLYDDLYDSLNPLFPSDHRVILTLRAPLAPSTSPLHSTLAFLKELLLALKERCAPVRDNDINELYRKLDEWNDIIPSNHTPNPDSSPSRRFISTPLASLIVDTFRRTIPLSDVMKADLDTAILGSTSEDEVKAMVFRKAKQQEREFILRAWSGRDLNGQLLRNEWRSWVTGLPETATDGPISPDTRWIQRLMIALGSNVAISCKVLPSISPTQAESDNTTTEMLETNELPPQFLFTSRKLFLIQNYLQALAIAAALRVLSGLPVSKRIEVPVAPNFVDRIWTLLKMEVETAEMGKEMTDEATKLVNLADEVVRARRLASASNAVDNVEEARIREAVDRTLKPQDPVFILLRQRLIDGIGKRLLAQYDTSADLRRVVPEVIKAGKGYPNERAVKRPRLHSSEEDAVLPPYGLLEGALPSLVIKGFEDPVLVKAISEVFVKTFGCIQWIAAAWSDFV